MNEKWFAMPIAEIEKKLKTNAACGLSLKAARSRCAKAKKEKEAPFFSVKRRRWDMLLLDLLSDFFLVMLILVSVFSLFFEGDYVIGLGMLLLICVNLGVSFFLYFKQRRGMDTMSSFFSPTARVIRGGKLYIADYGDVVPGDVIIVEKGDIIGCDARLVHSDGLSVVMKLDKKKEKQLQKLAGGVVAENELYAENMTNMIHAGSTVSAGVGRAIVVATGEYTYLGAITGGITEVPSTELPDGLAVLKKRFSTVGMMLLILTLPFCIFSLLFGHFTGGNVLLSEVLSVVLAIGATAMLSRCPSLLLGFFTRYIRKAALAEDPCMIRSVKALDDLTDADYLFMLDGSIATDGILHFETLATVDGETSDLERRSQNATMLCDMIALYSMARERTLGVVGGSSTGALDVTVGLGEFMKKSGADTEALRIRCNIASYLPGVDGSSRDVLTYTDRGERYEMSVCSSVSAIDRCTRAYFSGVAKELTDEGREALRGSFLGYVANGRRPLIFTADAGQGEAFVGMMVLREGIDTSIVKAISALRRNKVRIIAFSNCVGRTNAPEIPDALRRGSRVYAGDLLKKGLPVTHGFGSYDEYCGFDESMIAELAQHVRAQGKTLAVLGFSDYAASVIHHADVFISCAPVRAGAGGTLEEEIRSLEIPGEQSSASCTQTVKAEADILLMRPTLGKGGLEPLAKAIEYCKVAYRNLNNFLVYLLCVQAMRLITVAFPMLFGNSTADARQLLFLGFVMDLFAMAVFMGDGRRSREEHVKLKESMEKASLTDTLKSNSRLFICVVTGSVLTLLLPNFFGMLSFFGSYLYKAEFTFISLALMQLLTMASVYADGLCKRVALKRLLENKIVLAEICVLIVFTVICLLTPVGAVFGVSRIKLFYLLLSLVPPVGFVLGDVIVNAVQRRTE